MNETPVVKSFRLTSRGDLLVDFTDRTSITFVSADNGSAGLDSVVVSCRGKQIAYCNVRRWRPGSAVVFDGLTAPATPALVGVYCLAAYDMLHEDIDDVKSDSTPSMEDHLRILDVISPGEECYLAMKNGS